MSVIELGNHWVIGFIGLQESFDVSISSSKECLNPVISNYLSDFNIISNGPGWYGRRKKELTGTDTPVKLSYPFTCV